ncbi:polysaccharide deacetylase family protein [Pontibacter pamirensis]|uniref:polysaccharide deacetylase family protein n=1 Tax=Pontibacter pamirensis TaxID=2562824 RepID=UPI001389D3E6|nr:polysaccharide deacetylase family protein [Pontibacter pamirensis]
MKDIPVFTISLDFELYWGIFDKVPLESRYTYFDNTRQVIPQILSLFKQNNVHASWATVGMLMAADWDDWRSFTPAALPDYTNKKLSAYRLDKDFAMENGQVSRYFFAPDLVKAIRDTPCQEVGTHTFSHYYCREEGQTVAQFKSDLQAAKRIAERDNISLQSLVFPRNQYNEPYLSVCFEEGVKTVRANPVDWWWKQGVKDNLLRKVFRAGDCYTPLSQKTSFKLSSLVLQDGMPLSIPASRLLRPVHSGNFLNQLRLKRVLNEMTVAAKTNSCYHLWWHPHNFGDNPERSMADLKTIVAHFKILEKQYKMESMHMTDIYTYTKEQAAS